jgi:hypothetical protein
VLGASGCDVGADVAIGQSREVGLAQIAGIGGGFRGLAAETSFDVVDQRHELILIAQP